MRIDDLTWRIVDKPGETFRVHRSIYTDPEIFELEMKYIFESKLGLSLPMKVKYPTKAIIDNYHWSAASLYRAR